MVDEKKEAKAEVPTATDTEAGDKPEKLGKLERAERAVERLAEYKEIEKRCDEKIARIDKFESDRLLGSTAGGHVDAKPAKVETAKEYSDRVMNNQPTIKDAEN